MLTTLKLKNKKIFKMLKEKKWLLGLGVWAVRPLTHPMSLSKCVSLQILGSKTGAMRGTPCPFHGVQETLQGP